MLVSKLNNEYMIWVDYSTRWATTFEITQEEFAKIQSGLAEIVNDEVVDLPTPEPTEPVVADDGFCEVFVPMSIRSEPGVIAKIEEIKEIYLWNLLWKKETIDNVEYRKLYNIHIDNVSSFLSSEQYIQFSQAWVLFDNKIKALFKERMKVPIFYYNTSPFIDKINEIMALEWSVLSEINQNNTDYKMVEFRTDYINQVLDQSEYNFFAWESQWCRFSANIVGLFS